MEKFPHINLVERETELLQLKTILCQMRQGNPILVAEIGAGRTTLLKALYNDFVSQDLPDRLQEMQACYIDIESLLQEPGSILTSLNHHINQDNVRVKVLIFDGLEALANISEVLCAGIISWLKRQLKNEKIRIVLSCDNSIYENCFLNDLYFCQHCQRVALKTPSFSQAIVMIESHLHNIQQEYRITIEDGVISSVVALAHRYVRESVLPASALNLLDAAAAKVSMKSDDAPLQTEDVFLVISEWLDIPQKELMLSDEAKVRGCEKALKQQIYGQPKALQTIQETLEAGFLRSNAAQAIATMVFAGPNGIGKKATARALAKWFYGSEKYLVRFNMAQYQTAFSFKTLLGEDDQIGLLQISRQCPCAVYLFDDVDKAHSQVIDSLSNLLRSGQVGDQDLSQAIVIMTTNVELPMVMPQKEIAVQEEEKKPALLQLVIDGLPGMQAQNSEDNKQLKDNVEFDDSKLQEIFGVQFCQQFSIIPFVRLSERDLEELTQEQLVSLRDQLKRKYKVDLNYSDTFSRELLGLLRRGDYTPEHIQQLFSSKILYKVSSQILSEENEEFNTLNLTLAQGQVVCTPDVES